MTACYVRRMAGRAWTVRTNGNVFGVKWAREARSNGVRPDQAKRGRAPCACGGRGDNVIEYAELRREERHEMAVDTKARVVLAPSVSAEKPRRT